jgi:uncharacterized protein YndB with AHSA1/START domain
MTATATEKHVTTQVYRVFIKATPQAVWDAIIKPELTERYGYGCRVEYDLKPHGEYRCFANDGMRAHGAPDVIIVGQVVEADPPRRLVQTWHPIWDPTIAAEVTTRLTWEIEEEYGASRLTLTHDVTNAPITAQMVNGDMANAGGGWPFMISDLKTLLETGKALAG